MIPFMMVVSLAALQSIPIEVLEAASIDGASFFARLRFVILPLIRNVLMIIGLLQAVKLFQEITMPWVLTQGGPGNATTTLSLYVYKLAFQQWNFGIGVCGRDGVAGDRDGVRAAVSAGCDAEPLGMTEAVLRRIGASRRAPAARRMPRGGPLISYTLIVMSIVVLLFPDRLDGSTAFKTSEQAFHVPPVWWPRHPTVKPFAYAISPIMLRFFANSVIIAGLSAVAGNADRRRDRLCHIARAALVPGRSAGVLCLGPWLFRCRC